MHFLACLQFQFFAMLIVNNPIKKYTKSISNLSLMNIISLDNLQRNQKNPKQLKIILQMNQVIQSNDIYD